ncbi:flagellar hook-basal body complex protein [Nitrincola schmidtii]|uniref:flagellar hook-basal body complex protein n=1 Tax=Nitrincola schmidtii TaxID=1730894 RepID=UPI001F0F6197|nr:flagellar hook-basal body complex protein [Nitrincola schmidtii]
MSFNTAITGLKAASTMLDVTGNNIANVSTTGFKSSRTEFADIYATSVVGAGSSNSPGSGVTVAGISQDFSAGTIEFTNNNLDLAINGSGFFQLSDGQGSTTYTRAGAFELNKDGQIISKSGKFLQGYGLDQEGNRLPIGNLQVSQKESPPKATESIDLSFNIDARSDATRLLPEYDKDEPGSFTYTTTVRTFDSLGNEQTVKFNFVEQQPVRQEFSYILSDLLSAPGNNTLTISGVELDITSDFSETPPGSNIFNLNTGNAITPNGDLLLRTDPRIDLASVSIDNSGASPILTFDFKSQYTDSGSVLVRDTSTAAGIAGSVVAPDDVSKRPSNEVRKYALSLDPANTEGSISIGGVPIQVTGTMTQAELEAAIRSNEPRILDRNPDIESVAIVDGSIPGTREIEITFRASAGDVPDNQFRPEVTVNSGFLIVGQQTYTSGTNLATPNEVVEGDRGYLGHYRAYAYLNNEELLDIGKRQDPGTGTLTEPGSILLSFRPESGLLNGINVFGGNGVFTPGTQVPAITIQGADPANPNTNIRLDLTNSTQFASASIVKNQQQDGYTKGDLIGVTFAPTGEMIASFSNGQNQSLGVVAFATFENQDGLQPSGDTEWIATLASGNAILNPPGTGLNGTLRSAALEQSNVDLSTELVNLIQAQRNFQASSKTLETANNITQTILNI